MRGAISVSVTPVILGDESLAAKLAWSLFIRFGLRSNVFDRMQKLSHRILPFISFQALSESRRDRFTLMSLDRFCTELGDSIYILIPTTKEYKAFIDRNLEKLENKFIIMSPAHILERKELFPLRPTLRKDI